MPLTEALPILWVVDMYIENVKKGIRINFLVPVGLLFLFLLNGFLSTVVMLLAAAVHELGHIAAAMLCGVGVERFDLELWGGRMFYGGMNSYKKELFISLGGIVANLALAPLGLIDCFGIYGKLFFCACICYGLVNIIPAKTLDGGEALRCLLGLSCDEDTAYCAQNAVGALSVLFLCALGLILSIISGFNSSVLMLAVITVVLAVG